MSFIHELIAKNSRIFAEQAETRQKRASRIQRDAGVQYRQSQTREEIEYAVRKQRGLLPREDVSNELQFKPVDVDKYETPNPYNEKSHYIQWKIHENRNAENRAQQEKLKKTLQNDALQIQLGFNHYPPDTNIALDTITNTLNGIQPNLGLSMRPYFIRTFNDSEIREIAKNKDFLKTIIRSDNDIAHRAFIPSLPGETLAEHQARVEVEISNRLQRIVEKFSMLLPENYVRAPVVSDNPMLPERTGNTGGRPNSYELDPSRLLPVRNPKLLNQPRPTEGRTTPPPSATVPPPSAVALPTVASPPSTFSQPSMFESRPSTFTSRSSTAEHAPEEDEEDKKSESSDIAPVSLDEMVKQADTKHMAKVLLKTITDFKEKYLNIEKAQLRDPETDEEKDFLHYVRTFVQPNIEELIEELSFVDEREMSEDELIASLGKSLTVSEIQQVGANFHTLKKQYLDLLQKQPRDFIEFTTRTVHGRRGTTITEEQIPVVVSSEIRKLNSSLGSMKGTPFESKSDEIIEILQSPGVERKMKDQAEQYLVNVLLPIAEYLDRSNLSSDDYLTISSINKNGSKDVMIAFTVYFQHLLGTDDDIEKLKRESKSSLKFKLKQLLDMRTIEMGRSPVKVRGRPVGFPLQGLGIPRLSHLTGSSVKPSRKVPIASVIAEGSLAAGNDNIDLKKKIKKLKKPSSRQRALATVNTKSRIAPSLGVRYPFLAIQGLPKFKNVEPPAFLRTPALNQPVRPSYNHRVEAVPGM